MSPLYALLRKFDKRAGVVYAVVAFAAMFGPVQLRAQNATAQLEGTVHDASGRPVDAATVVLLGEARSIVARMQTNADGYFLFDELSARNYTVKVEAGDGHDEVSQQLALLPSEKKRCDLVIPPSNKGSSSPGSINKFELDDRASFTVAGVSDSTGYGGHGSETRVRTGEALAKETVKLGSEPHTKVTSTESAAAGRERVTTLLANGKNLSHEEQASLHRQLGDLDEALKDPLKALGEYQRAVDLDASEQNYFALGAELLLHRSIAPAVEVFGRGLRGHPNSTLILLGLAAALYTTGSIEEATQHLCRAADLEPANSAPYLFLGKMQEVSPNALPCAEQKLATFARDQPENALANYYYALALWKRGRAEQNSERLQQVEVLLKKAAALDPKFDSAHLQFGNLYFARGAFQDAVGEYLKAIEINARSSESHYRLGVVYKRIGEESKSKQEFAEYKALEHSESAAIESQRRELQQFIFTLKTRQ